MLNLRCGNAAAFSKHCNIVREAELLRGTDGWRTMEITSVDNDSMTLKNINDTKISSLHKVKTSDMGATMCEDGAEQFAVTWTFYIANLSKDNVLENNFQTLPIPGHSSSIEILPQDLTSKCITILHSLLTITRNKYSRRIATCMPKNNLAVY